MAIGKKEGGFALAGTDRDGAVAALSGTHDVAIYRAPAEHLEWIGPAKLTLSRAGSELTARLETASGTLVQQVSNDMDNPRNFGQATVTPLLGKVLIDERGALPFERIDFNAAEDGFLYGVAGGLGQVGFRNAITAYGAGVPGVLSALEGRWTGNHQAALCRAPVEATFVAGSVTVKGIPQPGCGAEQTVTTGWDGNDDYVVPNAAGNPQIFLDSSHGGGSQPAGGILMDLTPSGGLAQLRLFFAGFDGEVASLDLQKQ